MEDGDGPAAAAPGSDRRALGGGPPRRALPGRRPPPLPSGTVAVDPEAEREPVTDVILGRASVYVTIELPGVRRRDIDLRATEASLVVSASSSRHRYFREIPLPVPVRTDAITSTYKNGVLDVTLERMDAPRTVPVR